MTSYVTCEAAIAIQNFPKKVLNIGISSEVLHFIEGNNKSDIL